jgi:DNA polymerase III alpha subunit
VEKIGEDILTVESPNLRGRQLYWHIREDGAIVQGLSNIKGVTPEPMQEFLDSMTDEDLDNWESFVDAHVPVERQLKKSTKIDKKWKFGKKIFLSLLYSGALDYMEGGINEKITKWNEHRKDKIPIINTSAAAEAIHKEYSGWWLGDIKVLNEYRKYFKELDIIDKTIEENFNKESAECVDVFKVVSVIKSKTKNNKIYQKVKCQIGYETYTVFLWRAGHNLVDNSICIGKFSKNGDFWTLQEWEELQK